MTSRTMTEIFLGVINILLLKIYFYKAYVTLWYYVAAFDKATSAKASFDKHQVYSYKAYAIMLT